MIALYYSRDMNLGARQKCVAFLAADDNYEYTVEMTVEVKIHEQLLMFDRARRVSRSFHAVVCKLIGAT